MSGLDSVQSALMQSPEILDELSSLYGDPSTLLISTSDKIPDGVADHLGVLRAPMRAASDSAVDHSDSATVDYHVYRFHRQIHNLDIFLNENATLCKVDRACILEFLQSLGHSKPSLSHDHSCIYTHDKDGSFRSTPLHVMPSNQVIDLTH